MQGPATWVDTQGATRRGARMRSPKRRQQSVRANEPALLMQGEAGFLLPAFPFSAPPHSPGVPEADRRLQWQLGFRGNGWGPRSQRNSPASPASGCTASIPSSP